MAPEQTNKVNMGRGKEEKCKPELKREETTEQPQQKKPHNQNSTAKSEAWKNYSLHNLKPS